MSYRVEIRCDIQRGNSLEKQRCESLRGVASTIPEGEAPKADDAVRRAETRARGLGWVKKRRSGRPTAWICGACQE